MWKRRAETVRREGIPWVAIAALASSIGVALVLTLWLRSRPSFAGEIWKAWVLQGVWWVTMLGLLWATIRGASRGRRLAWGYVVVGVLAHVYRVVVTLLPASNSWVNSSLEPLQNFRYFALLAFFLLWVGLLSLVFARPTWIRRLFDRATRLDLPVLGTMLFLALFFALREYPVWGGVVSSSSGVRWSEIIGLTVLATPLLLYVPFLAMQMVRHCRRGVEWVVAGLLLLGGIELQSGGFTQGDWISDAAVIMVCVGLVAAILPRPFRPCGPAVAPERIDVGLPSEN